MAEDPLRLNARRLAAAALVLYAVSFLLILGMIVAMDILLSAFSLTAVLKFSITAKVVGTIAGLALINIGFILYMVFGLYAGFKGRGVVSKIDLAGWEEVVKNLGKLYFAAALFLVIGGFLAPGIATQSSLIMLLAASTLLMISALLVPSPERSIEAGVILIIAAILSSLVGRVSVPSLSQLAETSQVMSVILPGTVFSAVALVVGVALMMRGIVLKGPIAHIVAAVGGVIYAASLVHVGFSYASLLSERLTPVEPAYWIRWVFYSMAITGSSLMGIAGTLGIAALILAMLSIAKSWFPGLARVAAPPAPTGLPIRELRYCPSCGVSVSPEDVYCRNCGKKLR